MVPGSFDLVPLWLEYNNQNICFQQCVLLWMDPDDQIKRIQKKSRYVLSNHRLEMIRTAVNYSSEIWPTDDQDGVLFNLIAGPLWLSSVAHLQQSVMPTIVYALLITASRAYILTIIIPIGHCNHFFWLSSCLSNILGQ